MPTYEYRPTSARHCIKCVDGFDAVQKMADAPLDACPVCRAPVRRVMCAPALGTTGPSLSRENLEKHGFTQYRKSKSGDYEKTAGDGPETIKK